MHHNGMRNNIKRFRKASMKVPFQKKKKMKKLDLYSDEKIKKV